MLDTNIYDEVVTVTGEDAIQTARRMATEEPAGRHLVRRAVWSRDPGRRRPENAGKLIVVIIPSFGERYLSTVLFEHLDV